MGTIYGSNESSRRSRPQSARETVRSTQHTHRRKVLPIGNNGICMRPYSPKLLQQNEGAEPDQDGNRTETIRVGGVEGAHSTTTSTIPSAFYNPTLHVSTQPSEPRRSAIMHGMSSLSIRRTVTFSGTITIRRCPQESRKGPWMQIAVDGHRFLRRIKQTFGNTFTDIHREKMLCYINKMCDTYCFLFDRIGQTRVVQVNNFYCKQIHER